MVRSVSGEGAIDGELFAHQGLVAPAMTAEELAMALMDDGLTLPSMVALITAYSAAWQEVEFGPVLERSMAAAVESWEAKLRALEEENARLLGSLQNMRGAFDTPVARRRGNYDAFQEEAVRSMRDVLAALRAKEASKPSE